MAQRFLCARPVKISKITELEENQMRITFESHGPLKRNLLKKNEKETRVMPKETKAKSSTKRTKVENLSKKKKALSAKELKKVKGGGIVTGESADAKHKGT